jgi:hypothetical protein
MGVSLRRRLPLTANQNHAFPQIRQAAETPEFEHFEAVLFQQPGQGAAAPEFDVAAVPEGVVVGVLFVGDRQGATIFSTSGTR